MLLINLDIFSVSNNWNLGEYLYAKMLFDKALIFKNVTFLTHFRMNNFFLVRGLKLIGNWNRLANFGKNKWNILCQSFSKKKMNKYYLCKIEVLHERKWILLVKEIFFSWDIISKNKKRIFLVSQQPPKNGQIIFFIIPTWIIHPPSQI